MVSNPRSPHVLLEHGGHSFMAAALHFGDEALDAVIGARGVHQGAQPLARLRGAAWVVGCKVLEPGVWVCAASCAVWGVVGRGVKRHARWRSLVASHLLGGLGSDSGRNRFV